MRALLFLISLVLSSAACSGQSEQPEDTGADAAATPSAVAPDIVAAEPRVIEAETEQYAFDYSWPAAAAAIPELSAALGQRAERMRAALVDEAQRDWVAAAGKEWQPRQHSASMEWKIVADLPGWLSLSGHLATYSGGAHGMTGVESLVWDRQAKTAVEGIDMFASPVALEQALGGKLCAALDAEREKRRGTKIEEGSKDSFDKCPGLDEASVLIGSSNGRSFDRITVYFGPYVAGAYAEGAYQIDLPVTASVVDAVKPAYADAFTVNR